MGFVIQWINRFSGESGYVGEIKKNEGHFVNTFSISNAKIYKTERAAKLALGLLERIGEGVNNEFVVMSK